MSKRVKLTLFLVLFASVVILTLWKSDEVVSNNLDLREQVIGARDDFATSGQKPLSNRGDKNVSYRRKIPIDSQMNDFEFYRLKINLPIPVNQPWEGPLYNSQSAFEGNFNDAAVDVLPLWIRKAMLKGESDIAARYLWTFLKFVEDSDPKIETKAVMSLYLMGDYDGIASKKIQKWIEEDFKYSFYSSGSGQSKKTDIRALSLRELELNNDHRLDQAIYETWERYQKDRLKEDLDLVDYGYYLEKQGRNLPEAYWLDRLDSPQGYENTLKVFEKSNNVKMTEKLKNVFTEFTNTSGGSRGGKNVGRAAGVASLLFRKTGEARYLDYIVSESREKIASSRFENSLPKLLDGLAATDDSEAFNIIASAIDDENVIIQEAGVSSLGRSRSPLAVELLVEISIQKIKGDQEFPGNELRALLSQNRPSADIEYDKLKKSLLSGQMGWESTISDFDSLEFFKKYGR